MASGKLSRLVVGALAALAVAAAGPALAQRAGGGGHGGGGGGFHGGGGSAFHGGGGSAFHGGGGSAFHGGGFHGGGAHVGGFQGGGNFHGGVGLRGGAPGFHGAGGFRGGGWHGGYGWRGYGGAGWLGYGLLFSALPLAYATYYWDGVPYYYADDNYYLWDSSANEYQTVAPPDGLVNEVTAAAPADSAQTDLYAYPKNGQSDAQQAKDRTDCQQWAGTQPNTDPAGTDAAKHSNYLQAEAACLTGKGYSVQ
jgi:hypothetical protein